MVSLSFKVLAAMVAAAAVQANSEFELEARDWESRRLVPRNFELLTTKLTLLVHKDSFKTVTKYKTVTVTADCGATTTFVSPHQRRPKKKLPYHLTCRICPEQSDPAPSSTETFSAPTETSSTTDSTVPTTTTDSFPLPTLTDPTTSSDTFTIPSDTLTAGPSVTDTGATSLPTSSFTDTIGVPGGNATTDPGATTTAGTETALPTFSDTVVPSGTVAGGSNATDPFGSPTSDPLASPTSDPFATTTTITSDPLASPTSTPAADPLGIFGPSTETTDVTLVTDPTAPTPTAPSIAKRMKIGRWN
ncbi:hypothetical protein RHS04_00315 [Rhizoctonia solani]|uniref:Uncharacterized protein n=1 Tax=Rhizoctonia solani TaxID=456999 RepID=A0A8H7HI33_9AGAM|nr:hypothetical protein RHS04_00315 [Rhizoctonia solani]